VLTDHPLKARSISYDRRAHILPIVVGSVACSGARRTEFRVVLIK
jgi:hypothetical protein